MKVMDFLLFNLILMVLLHKLGLVEGDTIAQIDGKDITTLLELKEQIDAKSPEIQFWYPTL